MACSGFILAGAEFFLGGQKKMRGGICTGGVYAPSVLKQGVHMQASELLVKIYSQLTKILQFLLDDSTVH